MGLREGYKQTEVGIIPSDWEVVELSRLVQSDRKIRYGIVQPGKYDPQGRYMVRGQDYSFGWASPESIFKVGPIVEERYKNARLQEGDVIITIVGASTGHIEIVPSLLDGANITQTTGRIAIDADKASNLFCKYILLSKYGKFQVSNFIKGGAQPGLNIGDIEKFLIPLPTTKAEQTAIATALSDADALIISLEKLIAKKRNIKQGAMQELLTGKKRLPGFSGKWEVKKLGEIADYKNGKSFENYINENGNYFLITLNSIDIKGQLKSEHLRIDINDNSLNKYDLVMILSDVAHGNFLGLTDVIPEDNKYVLNQRVGALKNLRGVLPFYLSKFININQKYFKMIGQGSSQQNLGKDDILNFEILIPPIPEQTAIAQILSDMDEEIEQLEQKLHKYRVIKQGMMQELLTGKTRLV